MCVLRFILVVLYFVFFFFTWAIEAIVKRLLSPRGSEATPSVERREGDGDEIQD